MDGLVTETAEENVVPPSASGIGRMQPVLARWLADLLGAARMFPYGSGRWPSSLRPLSLVGGTKLETLLPLLRLSVAKGRLTKASSRAPSAFTTCPIVLRPGGAGGG